MWSVECKVTEVGGTPELITHGESGLLVPPGQPERLADALVGLLEDPAGADAIRQAARRRVEDRFSLARMTAAHEALYGESPRRGSSR